MSKILYVASSMRHINNFHIPYITKLREDGHTVKIMAAGDGAHYNIPFVKSMLSLKNLFLQRKIRRIIKREKFDALILNTTLAAFHVRMALPKKNRPKVLNIVHGYLFSESDRGIKAKILLFCEKLLRKKTDVIAVMNAEDERIAKKNRLALDEVIMTLGMGAVASEKKFDVDYIRRYTDTEDKFVISFVGELSERKNQRFLICALPEIKISIPNAVLVLVGEGAEENELRNLAEKLGVADSVRFVGQKTNPCDFMRASDLYASVSEIEGMPFNLIEALGCGVPILASNTKGHTDLIDDGDDGYLYERGCSAEFISRVKTFAIGDASVDAEHQAAKYKKYSFEEVFPKTYGVIKDFCDDKN